MKMINNFKVDNFFKVGLISFNIGLLFLASAPFLSIIFLISSLIFSTFIKTGSQLKDKNNLIFLIASIVLLFNGIFIHNIYSSGSLSGWDTKLSVIGLINWLPFFFCFKNFQIYLENIKLRKLSIKFLIIGSIPILITGFGQYFLGWDQTIKLLQGSIIWYIKPIENISGLSGLFNNPNYASAWLSILWPFCLIKSFKNKYKSNNKLFVFFMLIIYFLCLILTNSRTGWISILISIPVLLSISFLKTSLIILFLLFIIFLIAINLNFLPSLFLDSIFKFIPNKLSNLLYFNFSNIDLYPRLDIWNVAIKSIIKNPLFGWGAASFPMLYTILRNESINDIHQHSHNLFLELSINYGLIASILIFYNFFIIIFESYKIIFQKYRSKDFFHKAWWTATVIALFTQTFDVTYYDLRISLLLWIMFTGLKSSTKELKT